jgi:hypothetical protein
MSMVFTDINTGYIVGSNDKILKTTDSGDTWIPLTTGTTGAIFSCVRFADANTGFVAGGQTGNESFILRTDDAGAHWTPQPTGTSNYLNTVRFTDPANGFAAGDLGTIVKTTDGGAHWAVLNSGTTKNLRAIAMQSSTLGHAVGDTGTILRTVDGGGFPVGCPELQVSPRCLTLSPNPVSTLLTVSVPEAESGELVITDCRGREILRQRLAGPTAEVNVARLQAGLYFVRLTSGSRDGTGKFVKL